MIVTGQQPAVGGGPFYTLVKVAHAAALGAARGEPVLFWCASEDHDLGEAGHADLVRRDGRIHRFASDLGGGRASLRFRPARIWWDGLIEQAVANLGPGAGSAFLFAHAPTADEGMGAWLCRLLTALFPGLQTAEAHTLRPRWGGALQRALDHWPAAELAELRARLLVEGAADAFGPLDAPPLFRDLPSGREPLTVAGARALLPASLGELSPGAALRPVLQQAALPCTAYVGGPGELAYHRFITPVYGALGVNRPELVPRCSLTLIPAWFARACARRGCAPEAIPTQVDQPSADDGRLAALDAAIATLGDEPRLAGSVRRLRNERVHLARRLARIERSEKGLLPLGTLQAWLSPRGVRQERTMSLFQAIWEFGPGLAPLLVREAAGAAPGEHRCVTV